MAEAIRRGAGWQRRRTGPVGISGSAERSRADNDATGRTAARRETRSRRQAWRKSKKGRERPARARKEAGTEGGVGTGT